MPSRTTGPKAPRTKSPLYSHTRYDAVGNNTGQTWYNADHSVANILTFTYDADGRQLTAANNVGTYTMAYDAVGKVSTVQGLWGTLLTFTYDANGNRTVVQDNFGGVTTNVYDADGNLTQQLFGGTGQTPMRVDQSYNADDELSATTRYSDLSGSTTVAASTYVYDAVGDLTGQTDKNGGGTAINVYTYVYDADSRITSEQLNGGTPTTYGYDATSQLTNDGGTSETYDAEGNRTNTGDSTGTGNELESDGTWDYTYDAAGNETMKVAIEGGEAWTYSYDNKNELVKAQLWESDPVTYGTGDAVLEEVDYKYDAWGNLVERDLYPTGSGTPTVTRYAVDGWNPALAGQTGNANFNVWADLDGSNDLLTRYLHGDQVDQLFARQDAGVQYWYLTDYQGSVRDVLDNSSNVKDAIVYDGFGNIISETNSAYRGSYAWTGRMFDVETDLQYNRARWYDPSTGRWQSQDPLGFDAGDSNLYTYVNNDPLAAVDPSGDFGEFFGGNLSLGEGAGQAKGGLGTGAGASKGGDGNGQATSKGGNGAAAGSLNPIPPFASSASNGYKGPQLTFTPIPPIFTLPNHDTYTRGTWQLQGGTAGPNGGWIIQEITVYLRDEDGNWHPAPGSKGHYYEAWNVNPNQKQTAQQDAIATKKNVTGLNGIGWAALANLIALTNLNRLVNTCNEKGLAQDLLDELNKAIQNNSTTAYSRADDWYGMQYQYWQNQAAGEGYNITGIKFVGRATFVQKLNPNETLQDWFWDYFVYDNQSTGAGPLLQSMRWRETDSIVGGASMDQFMGAHSHSAGIDHIVESTWKSGAAGTTVKGP